MMIAEDVIARVGVCETQPLTAEGLKTLLTDCQDLEYAGATDSLHGAVDFLRAVRPTILVIDKAFGIQSVLEWIADRHILDDGTRFVVWGLSLNEAEALRFLQVGARGIVRKTADPATILTCLRTVARGSSWMEDAVFRDGGRLERYPRSELTPREQQVMELVEQGLKNKEIARELGIRPGTVKIHLKHIFEKTGVRGRYGLALTGMKEKGLLALP